MGAAAASASDARTTDSRPNPAVAWEAGFGFEQLQYGRYAHGRGDYVALRPEGLFMRHGDLLLGWRYVEARPYFEPSLFRQLPHVEGETWVSRDGTKVVRLHAGTLSVSDSISGGPHWSVQNVSAGTAALVHPAPGTDEVVVFSNTGQCLRWELSTGNPLPTVSLPKGWHFDGTAVPLAAPGGTSCASSSLTLAVRRFPPPSFAGPAAYLSKFVTFHRRRTGALGRTSFRSQAICCSTRVAARHAFSASKASSSQARP